MTEIITQILGLQVKFGTQKRIAFQNIDVKSAFRKLAGAPDRAAMFACLLEDLIDSLASNCTSGGAGARVLEWW